MEPRARIGLRAVPARLAAARRSTTPAPPRSCSSAALALEPGKASILEALGQRVLRPGRARVGGGAIRGHRRRRPAGPLRAFRPRPRASSGWATGRGTPAPADGGLPEAGERGLPARARAARTPPRRYAARRERRSRASRAWSRRQDGGLLRLRRMGPAADATHAPPDAPRTSVAVEVASRTSGWT